MAEAFLFFLWLPLHHRVRRMFYDLVLGAGEAVNGFGAVSFAHAMDRHFGDAHRDIGLKSIERVSAVASTICDNGRNTSGMLLRHSR